MRGSAMAWKKVKDRILDLRFRCGMIEAGYEGADSLLRWASGRG